MRKALIDVDDLTYDTLKILAKKKGILIKTYIAQILTDHINNTDGTDKIKEALNKIEKIEA